MVWLDVEEGLPLLVAVFVKLPLPAPLVSAAKALLTLELAVAMREIMGFVFSSERLSIADMVGKPEAKLDTLLSDPVWAFDRADARLDIGAWEPVVEAVLFPVECCEERWWEDLDADSLGAVWAELLACLRFALFWGDEVTVCVA